MSSPIDADTSVPGHVDDLIHALVARNLELRTRQGSHAEYHCIARAIARHAPGKVLVFGVGRDSAIWIEANRGGRTVFVEHEPEWIESSRRQVPGIVVLPVRYTSRRYRWRTMLDRPDALQLANLSPEVAATKWDVVFVDSPQGSKPWHPGRMQSIFTAAQLARRSTDIDVLVHDCDRRVERSYCDRFLGPENLIEEVRKLRHYRL